MFVVQHGMVYQDCDANGRWVTVKNTSECDFTDPSPVRNAARVFPSTDTDGLKFCLQLIMSRADISDCVEEKLGPK